EYMAPEQAAGRRVGSAADVYSLGVVLFEWLAGVRPVLLRAQELDACLAELARAKPTPLRDFRRGVPDPVARLVDGMLERKPGKRPTARAVAEECERLRRELG